MAIHSLMTLQQLENLSSSSTVYQRKVNIENFRLQAVKQAALQMGIQTGLAAESQEINHILTQKAEKLDQIFNFGLVVYDHNILPPVITQAKNTVHLSPNAQTIRVGGQVYKIIKQVRFTSTIPTWRDYLWMGYKYPTLPNHVLLPRNDEERSVWESAVRLGYNEGVKQALAIYHINLNKMVRDFTGMVLYKTLLTENLISPFYSTEKSEGVIGNKNDMTIDSRLLNIKTQPQLQLHSQLWRPVLMNNN